MSETVSESEAVDRARGPRAEVVFETLVPSPVGLLALAVTEEALVGIRFLAEGSETQAVGVRFVEEGSPTPSGDSAGREAPIAAQARRELAEYFAGTRRRFDVPVKLDGTAFQHAVWAALRGVTWGQTVSYGALAARIGRPGAARAVGAANGSNPVPIIVPCHRVIGADGSLTGYSGGAWRKRWLLDHEAP